MKRWLPGDFDARADAKRWNHETSYPDPHEWVKVQKNVSAGLAATAAEAQRLKLAKAKAIEERPRLWSADDLSDPQRQEWLATGHVPKSAVTLLVGDEGIGKSLWWVWLCGYITTGNSCPEFGIPAREPAHVILVVTEDDWSTTVRPRLDVAGVDRAYVHVLCEAKDGSGSPTFPDDMGEIENAPFTPALIVVDAWLDTVPAKWSVRDPQQARLALHPWKDLATRTGAAVLLLTHTNRANTANARDKYGATAELRKKARMTLFAQADSDDDTCMIVGPEKSNIALAAKATRFRKVPKDHFDPTDDNDGTVPLLEYVGLEDKSSRELIAEAFHGPEDDESDERTDAEEAEEWLVDFLSEVNEVGKRGKPKTEPVPGKTVRDAARAAGIKEHTLKRAAKKIGVIYSKAGFPATNHWSLDDLSFDPETLPPVVRGSDPFNDHSD
ncbi:AAA family ATPase [Nocardia vinacea]|uniref:AAA family ATPase n=2 Tax=Nocardia vinacea TaxID=96468 RepID=A0ABZ1Z5Z8_9NOCA